jgi:hypothetical protein
MDSDEKITAAWLNALGLVGCGRCGLRRESPIELRIWPDIEGKTWATVIDTRTAQSIRLPVELTTQGQVIALLQALGVTIERKLEIEKSESN